MLTSRPPPISTSSYDHTRKLNISHYRFTFSAALFPINHSLSVYSIPLARCVYYSMMFALAQPPLQHAFHHPTSSPLSPLNSNASRFKVDPNMACKPTSSPTLSRKPSFFTSSRVQQTPALTRRDPQKVREKRRFEFLNKVKQKREEKNFENRFEQVNTRACYFFVILPVIRRTASTTRCYSGA